MKVAKEFSYGRQSLNDDDIGVVAQTLRSDVISQGPRLQEFERRIASYCHADYCLAVANGTAGLHLACMSLGLKHSDTGWTSSLSFVASANAIRFCNAKVDFVDIDPGTFNITPSLLREKFDSAATYNVVPKVIIPVHFAGQSCDLETIKEIADFYDCKVIEDACHALGGDYRGEKIGCCRFSEFSVFSLHPVKSITTGEGGLLLTNNRHLYEKAKMLRAHGIVRGESVMNQSVGPWHAEMQTEGYNYKISEIQCALGISQLNRLDTFIEKRTALSERYQNNLRGLPLRFQMPFADAKSAWHIMLILIDFDNIGKTKRGIYEKMRQAGINLSVHYLPIHLNPFYQQLGFRKGQFPAAEHYYEQAFSLPLHPGLGMDDVDFVCDNLKNALTS